MEGKEMKNQLKSLAQKVTHAIETGKLNELRAVKRLKRALKKRRQRIKVFQD